MQSCDEAAAARLRWVGLHKLQSRIFGSLRCLRAIACAIPMMTILIGARFILRVEFASGAVSGGNLSGNASTTASTNASNSDSSTFGLVGFVREQIIVVMWDRVAVLVSMMALCCLAAATPLASCRWLVQRRARTRRTIAPSDMPRGSRAGAVSFAPDVAPSGDSGPPLRHAAHTLRTAPFRASLNAVSGCGFFLELHNPTDDGLLVDALHLAGDLGHVHVFTERRSCGGAGSGGQVEWPRGLAEGLRGWVAVGDGLLAPSWGASACMQLQLPIPLPPRQRRHVYVRVSRSEADADGPPLESAGAGGEELRRGRRHAERYPVIGELLPRCSSRAPLVTDGCLAVTASGLHTGAGHLLMGEGKAHELEDVSANGGAFVPTGAIVFRRVPAPPPRPATADGAVATATAGHAAPAADVADAVDAAQAALDERLSSFDALVPSIHPPNHMLIAEWNAVAHDAGAAPPISAPHLPLPLPRIPKRASLQPRFRATEEEAAATSQRVPCAAGSAPLPAADSPQRRPASPSEATGGARQPSGGAGHDASVAADADAAEVRALSCANDGCMRLWSRWLATKLALARG